MDMLNYGINKKVTNEHDGVRIEYSRGKCYYSKKVNVQTHYMFRNFEHLDKKGLAPIVRFHNSNYDIYYGNVVINDKRDLKRIQANGKEIQLFMKDLLVAEPTAFIAEE